MISERWSSSSTVPPACARSIEGLGGVVIDGDVKNHLSYLPHSGSVLAELGDDVAGYETSKGSLTFPIDKPLPKRLVKKLVAARMRELGMA